MTPYDNQDIYLYTEDAILLRHGPPPGNVAFPYPKRQSTNPKCLLVVGHFNHFSSLKVQCFENHHLSSIRPVRTPSGAQSLRQCSCHSEFSLQ